MFDSALSKIITGLGGIASFIMLLWMVFDMLVPLLGGNNLWETIFG
jgi:hypothetical protein